MLIRVESESVWEAVGLMDTGINFGFQIIGFRRKTSGPDFEMSETCDRNVLRYAKVAVFRFVF